MRVRVPGHVHYHYPDVSVVCGRPLFDPDDRKQTTIMNPRVLIEVLSDSTEHYDSSEKFRSYQKSPHLEEYILVSQHRPSVETRVREKSGAWLLNVFEGMEQAVPVKSIDLTLPMAEIYAGVELPEAS